MSESSESKPLEKDDWSFEAEHNAVGFFDLLLKIDRRINPDNHKEKIQGKQEK